ncbi:hypothetical protein VA596_38360 [Amycolatopsis sp., V23-08]|uniref:Uncharacterized protein n=1 Tax=Amycolatopsis heterodermiae TaxID=3110235 RepID=A0ABU5RGN4_9PSEU|nr:hypothetical protein [Amycolatopsis sp., V23-08]MEA5365441.1 hypothetical protein [Amycolatopsis sp., V23-08]
MTTVPWGFVALTLVLLTCTAGIVLALVHKILAAERDVRIRIRVVPWPRVEIDVKR